MINKNFVLLNFKKLSLFTIKFYYLQFKIVKFILINFIIQKRLHYNGQLFVKKVQDFGSK